MRTSTFSFRKAFSTPDVEKALRPVIGIEEFGAGIVGE